MSTKNHSLRALTIIGEYERQVRGLVAERAHLCDLIAKSTHTEGVSLDTSIRNVDEELLTIIITLVGRRAGKPLVRQQMDYLLRNVVNYTTLMIASFDVVLLTLGRTACKLYCLGFIVDKYRVTLTYDKHPFNRLDFSYQLNQFLISLVSDLPSSLGDQIVTETQHYLEDLVQTDQPFIRPVTGLSDVEKLAQIITQANKSVNVLFPFLTAQDETFGLLVDRSLRHIVKELGASSYPEVIDPLLTNLFSNIQFWSIYRSVSVGLLEWGVELDKDLEEMVLSLTRLIIQKSRNGIAVLDKDQVVVQVTLFIETFTTKANEFISDFGEALNILLTQLAIQDIDNALTGLDRLNPSNIRSVFASYLNKKIKESYFKGQHLDNLLRELYFEYYSFLIQAVVKDYLRQVLATFKSYVRSRYPNLSPHAQSLLCNHSSNLEELFERLHNYLVKLVDIELKDSTSSWEQLNLLFKESYSSMQSLVTQHLADLMWLLGTLEDSPSVDDAYKFLNQWIGAVVGTEERSLVNYQTAWKSLENKELREYLFLANILLPAPDGPRLSSRITSLFLTKPDISKNIGSQMSENPVKPVKLALKISLIGLTPLRAGTNPQLLPTIINFGNQGIKFEMKNPLGFEVSSSLVNLTRSITLEVLEVFVKNVGTSPQEPDEYSRGRILKRQMSRSSLIFLVVDLAHPQLEVKISNFLSSFDQAELHYVLVGLRTPTWSKTKDEGEKLFCTLAKLLETRFLSVIELDTITLAVRMIPFFNTNHSQEAVLSSNVVFTSPEYSYIASLTYYLKMVRPQLFKNFFVDDLLHSWPFDKIIPTFDLRIPEVTDGDRACAIASKLFFTVMGD